MPNIEITREEFTKLYYEMTVKKLAEKLNVKENQVLKIAKSLKLKKQRGKYTDFNKLVLKD